MFAFEMFTWVVLGVSLAVFRRYLGMGARRHDKVHYWVAPLAALVVGGIVRSRTPEEWLVGGYSLLSVMLAGISAVVAMVIVGIAFCAKETDGDVGPPKKQNAHE